MNPLQHLHFKEAGARALKAGKGARCTHSSALTTLGI